MTILMIGFTKDDVTLTDNGTTKTITRKGMSRKVTVKGWSDDTHDIVYNSSLASYTPLLAAASTTQLSSEQTSKVQNAVSKAAGLATAQHRLQIRKIAGPSRRWQGGPCLCP